MTRRLHTNSKIFFKDPYVLRLDYSPDIVDVDSNYRTLIRRAYRLMQGTWGYSIIFREHAKIKNDYNQTFPPGPNHFKGMAQNLVISSLFNPDWVLIPRAYLCFEDKDDALQFRLSVAESALHVKIWPSCLFTIHEVLKDGE